MYDNAGAEIRRLAKEYRVSTKTIRRDLNSLMEIGYAIYDERDGERVFWRLMPGQMIPVKPKAATREQSVAARTPQTLINRY